jgi:hypothetical protein
MSRSKIKYKHIVDNVIKILQKEEKENNEKVHSYEEWLELLQGELKDED